MLPTVRVQNFDLCIFILLITNIYAGLKYMYSAGYVHRDLSTGNLLKCNGECKITDLEYAKPYERIDPRSLEIAAEHGFKTVSLIISTFTFD